MTDAPSVQRLRAMQRLALGLLLLAAALYVLTRVLESRHPGLGYLRAFCEAAMVGGLADWFAVTALFRRPLGLPIPHTAIVPANKDRIGDALGRFVEHNFLTADVVGAKLAEVDFAGRLAHWLAEPAHSAPLAGRLSQLLPALLDALEEAPARRFLQENAAALVRRVDLGPLLADLIEALATQGRHQGLLDELLRQAQRLLQEAEPGIRERVRAKTAWLWQRVGLDARVSDRMIEAVEEALQAVADDPDHPWRQRFTELAGDYAQALRHAPDYRERANALKAALLEHPLFTRYVGELWSALRHRVREDAERPDSALRGHLETGLVRLGQALEQDPAVRQALNAWARHSLTSLALARRHEVAQLIGQTVRGWDAGTVSEKLERAVGRDLQYIRINGTLIGGLVGLVLHALSHVLA